jgi:hypothetical protein
MMCDDGVATGAIGAGFVGTSLADYPEAVRVVNVERGTVAATQTGEHWQVEDVSGHRVHTVHADQSRSRGTHP